MRTPLKRMPKNDSFVQTPDGPGNVSDVNLLKETVKVRLDERAGGSPVLPQLRGVRPAQRQGQPGGHRDPQGAARPLRRGAAGGIPCPRHHCRLCRRSGGAGGGPPPQPPPQRRQGQRASCGASGGKAGGKAGGEAAGGQSPPPYPQRQARRQRHQALSPQPDAKPVSRQESQRPIEDEGPSNKRPRHRGGRRRGGQGGGTPKTEA